MITGALKSQIDAVWNVFWTGGISNPMDVIEQMTYLLFLKRLDEIETAAEGKARHSRAKAGVVSQQAFPFMKSLGGSGSPREGSRRTAV